VLCRGVVAGTEAAGGWRLGEFKSATKWANQMATREWTPEQITEAIKHGARSPAPNRVHPGNSASAYTHPTTGRRLVIDDETGEILQLGGDGFRY
jgi:hypothetical protein